MNLINVTNKSIEMWAEQRGLHKADPSKQLLKLSEEQGELAEAFLKKNPEEIEDAIGDIQVVLIILCQQLGLDYEYCLESAWNEIKHRKGQMVDGTFLKESDLC